MTVDQQDPVETAEAFVRSLVAQGIDCLFLNPGTDTFPVQEALAKLEQLGQPIPRTVLCLFEVVALAAAHGYFAATGRAQAVLVHVDVGTQNLGGMVHNAQRGRAAVVIAAGRTPYTTDARQRGTRDTYIHWLQEQFDQHGIVRNFVKWDYELRRPDQVGEVVSRAFQIAASDPPGPVYLTLPREVLMAPASEATLVARDRTPPARFGAGDRDALVEVARLLVESERPLVLTAMTGRTRAGFDGLLRLAELLALPVVERRGADKFSNASRLAPGLRPSVIRRIGGCDARARPRRPVHSDRGAARSRREGRADRSRSDQRAHSVVELSDRHSRSEPTPVARWRPSRMPQASGSPKAFGSEIEARRELLKTAHERQRAAWDAAALAARDVRPVAREWLSYCLGMLQREAPDCIFVDETVTSSHTLWRYLGNDEPGTMFGSGGSGLGWGVGAAVGIKLAQPDRPVVALVGDGLFVFGEPMAALWAARTHSAPVLVVVFNNSCYNATREPLLKAYPDGYSARGRRVGIDLQPAPRYDLLAPVVDAVGERVEEPGAVFGALARGLELVRNGRSVILDVILEHP